MRSTRLDARSIIFKGHDSGRAILFLTAGGNQVSIDKATKLVGEPLDKADAALVRAQTGFAIGGVSPVGHLSAIQAFFDPRLLEFDIVWAAAGTPHHVFSCEPQELSRIPALNLLILLRLIDQCKKVSHFDLKPGRNKPISCNVKRLHIDLN